MGKMPPEKGGGTAIYFGTGGMTGLLVPVAFNNETISI